MESPESIDTSPNNGFLSGMDWERHGFLRNNDK
jgi:hypothetical protein